VFGAGYMIQGVGCKVQRHRLSDERWVVSDESLHI